MSSDTTRTRGVQLLNFSLIPLISASCLIGSSIWLNILAALDRAGTPTQQAAWVATAIGADLLKASCPLVAFAAIGQGAGLVRRASAMLLLAIALSFSTVNALTYSHAQRATQSETNARANDTANDLATDRARLEDKAANAKTRTEREAAEAKLSKLRTEAKSAPVEHNDPAAVALADYATALGMTVKADKITAWLSALPVLLLEIGSTLALLVSSGIRQPRPVEAPAVAAPIIAQHIATVPAIAAPAVIIAPSAIEPPAEVITAHEAKASSVVKAMAEQLRTLVANNNGELHAKSKREIARILDASPATASRALAFLAVTGAMVSVSDVGEIAIRIAA